MHRDRPDSNVGRTAWRPSEAASARLAMDRGSVRTIDRDGHLHVGVSNISKAGISSYLGREIPDWQLLGLQPDRTYELFRDPDELRKSAESFDGKPLLSFHRPVTAADHATELTVGAVNNVRWKSPFLTAELAVWDGEAIAGITSGEQKELSAGYRYVPVIDPGTYQGVRYDIRMTKIQGNHVALCAVGRVGSDVVVGDAMPHWGRSGVEQMAAYNDGTQNDDYEPDSRDPLPTQILLFLKNKLNPADWQTVSTLMTDLSELIPTDKPMATDAATFRGLQRRVQQGVAAEKARVEADFRARFPTASRLKHI